MGRSELSGLDKMESLPFVVAALTQPFELAWLG